MFYASTVKFATYLGRSGSAGSMAC